MLLPEKFMLVSIILPVHNCEEYLSEALRSLLKQSYKNIEIIAVDDCSKDNSFKILKTFAKKYKKVRAYKNVKKYGTAVTLNRLIKKVKSKSKFIAFMDPSDISSLHRIKRQVQYLVKNPETVVVGSQCKFIDTGGKLLRKSDFPCKNRFIYQSPLHGISIQFETVLINRTLLPKDILKFNATSKPFIYSDVFIKLLPYGKFANLKYYLYSRRSNPSAYPQDLRKHIVSLVKLWVNSIFNYDYRPSLRSIFSPIARR
ncbi:MAG: Glycosyl transferase family 2 [uncultured bacterium]|nr:MAG: Glycosyl transferase family 2 [uncultured bacterium]OGH14514.1 MAG: hypothetical protein A2687_05630 [Candidatus Levybacteria bacterium RIFCSPHIGHO2_01_FULL_38_26]